MPTNTEKYENAIRVIRNFEKILKGEKNKTDEQIKRDYYETFKKLNGYDEISLIKTLISYRQNLGFEIFRETTKSHIEKDIK
ncbi:MAG: hypothetical protein KAQ87_03700 [Candidatus Pacebacteria bacterium]|nr:hypothetical protein [Candidatus Paceibacterota bacterium]